MAQTGTEILSYRGDPNLGLGSNADIPAINPNVNFNPIIEAGRTAMLLNHENNILKYQQKINDRDKLNQALLQGQIDSKNLNALEEDRPTLNRLKDSSKEAFYKMVEKGGLNNSKAYADYLATIKDYDEAATSANARYLGIKLLEQEKSAETLPTHQKAYDEHIKQQLQKGIFGMVDPYQKALDFDHEKMNASSLRNALVTAGQISPSGQPATGITQWRSATTKTDKNGLPVITTKVTSKEAPLKVAATTKQTVPLSGITVNPNGTLSEFSQTPEKRIDYGTILANTTDDFLHDEEQQQYQNMWKSYFESGDPYSTKIAIDHANDRINQYNQELGLEPTDNGFVTPFVIGQNILVDPQTGKPKINMPTPEFQAKMALASIDGNYVEKPKAIFDKDIATHKLNLKKLEEEIRHNKATEGIDWKKYDLDKDKFLETTKGGEESKNAALVFATGLFGDLFSKASIKAGDGSAILNPTDIRKLTADQLKFLGKEQAATKDILGNTTSAGLKPLELKENEVMQVNPDGTVFIMQDAKFLPKENRWVGKWDNNRSTSVFNAARNLVNEENVKSGTKERNAYFPIDTKGKEGIIQIDNTGGGKTAKSSTTDVNKLSKEASDWKQEGNNWRYKDGTLYDAAGNVVKE